MNVDANRPWPHISPIRRWGPIIVVVAVVAATGAIASVEGGRSTTATTRQATGSAARRWAENPRLPITYEEAKEAGTTENYDWGARCDRRTGRLKVPSVYAPPCVPVWDGAEPWQDKGGRTRTDNGGDTWPGVTADTITVVYYVPNKKDLYSSLEALGVVDPIDTMERTFRRLVAAANQTFELYGRRVEVKRLDGSGDGKDPTAARADAIKAATEYNAFASIGGPTQTAAYQDELARRGVLCVGCGLSVPDSDFQQNAPHMWGTLPTPEQFVYGVLDYGIAHLWDRPARFAGDPDLRDKTRSFGIVHYEQDPPVFGDLQRRVTERYAKRGYRAAVTLTYTLDTNTLNVQAQTIIGKLKEAGVTSVVFLGDPLMPKFLTEAATTQDYFPEWVITGTVFTDSTAAGRLYDQRQWAHAFGSSTLPARTRPQLSESWRLYEWFYGEDPEATKTIQVLGPLSQELFIGLHMAGPHLTPTTYAGGMFRYPPSGGGPTNPRISFGFHGQFPNADYVGVDDLTAVWWDAEAEGPDEQGKPGVGMWRYVDGGRRYQPDDIPRGDVGDSMLFRDEGSVTIYDRVPPGDRPPDYPPWPGSPAATGD